MRAEEEIPRGEARKILVVDDEYIVAEALSEALEDLGFNVVGHADDGKGAVAKARAYSPDLICMDIVINGDDDGIEVAKKIRDELGIASVFTSAHSSEHLVERAKGADPAGFLVKPYDLSALRCTIEVAIAKADVDRTLRKQARQLEQRAELATLELQQVQSQLFHTQKMEAVGTLSGGVAHDFNNMLLPILGYAQLISDGLTDVEGAEDMRGHALEIHRAATSAATLTSQLLAFSRRQILEKQEQDIHALLASAKPMLERMLGEQVNLQFDLQEGLATCLSDAGQLEQVFLNLCVNARDAMPDGGDIVVKSEFLDRGEALRPEVGGDTATKWVCLSVQDNGVGMSASTAARLFEPFFSTKGNMGTGLGLSVAHGIVTQHGGEIRVVSAPGEGSRFDIFLPLSEPTRTAAIGGDSIPKSRLCVKEGGGERILVIEDEPQVRILVARALSKKGYEVVTAADLATAAELLKAERGGVEPSEFDLIFSDCILPDGNGVDFLRAQLTEFPDTKAILTTGYTDRENLLKTASEYGVPFLKKPYPLPKLFNAVRRTLDGEEVAIAG